jgi:hypothetical protein
MWNAYALEETHRALIRNGKPADKVDRLITIRTIEDLT